MTAETAVRVAMAAGDFVATLTPEQRERVLYAAEDPALREWIYFPSRSDRNGIAFGDFSQEQRAAAFRVAAAVLSERGYQQFRGILAAEDVLGVRNGTSHVNSGRYFIAFWYAKRYRALHGSDQRDRVPRRGVASAIAVPSGQSRELVSLRLAG